jgi:lauroyl/myristoyl acyltransferase
VTRWRFQSRKYERWLATLWLDLWKRPPWSGRFTVEHSEIIDRLLTDRPVVLVTVHTGWHMASGAWLLNRGLEIGSVILSSDSYKQVEVMRETDQWARYQGSTVFLRGDTRSMVRFLTPGRCFMIQVDHPQGKLVDFEWGGGQFQMASGAFRLARLANAVVVPIVALDDGVWRCRVHVGTPVPDRMISSGDEIAAATHVGRELLPLLAKSPDQLMGTNLLRGYRAGFGPSATESGFGREAFPNGEVLSKR